MILIVMLAMALAAFMIATTVIIVDSIRLLELVYWIYANNKSKDVDIFT